jgi:hypothetical protein
MKRPIPIAIAFFSSSGIARMTRSRMPSRTSSVTSAPSRTTMPIASGKPSPSPATSVNATTAFRPRPGAIAKARFVTSPMRMVMTPATRHVEASTPSNGRPLPSSPSTPAKLRIAGFTKMMYDMTTNVVAPATVSRQSVVPFSVKRKYPSSLERRRVPANEVILTPPSPPNRLTGRE